MAILSVFGIFRLFSIPYQNREILYKDSASWIIKH